ncbi:methyltransferase, TIGR04325 family [Consotaella salsifontis]|nr:methyltransferase, TIGR04325 family [Consotaella salsifontis]
MIDVGFRRAEFMLRPRRRSFSGAYASFDVALAAVPRGYLSGYAHEEIADICFEEMCSVMVWDYPVLFWLSRLHPWVSSVLDAGGHMGTKFRAFDPLLSLKGNWRWIVYDTPPVVAAGRKRAEADGLDASLSFVDNLADAEPTDLLLASGLFQYFNGTLSDFLSRLPALPPYVILNKVALRDGETVVTLERIGKAYVPYQIRNRASFLQDIASAGYVIADRWVIPSLSHSIRSHPELGKSTSCGFYLRRAGDTFDLA